MLPSYLLLPWMPLSKTFVEKASLGWVFCSVWNPYSKTECAHGCYLPGVWALSPYPKHRLCLEQALVFTHSPGKPRSVCIHKRHTVGLKTKILLVCKCLMQSFAYAKWFWRHSVLLKNSLGAEIQLLLHWQSFLMYEEHLRWAGKTSLSSCDPPPMLAFHGVVLPHSKLNILGEEVAPGTEKHLILHWGPVPWAGMRISLLPSTSDGAAWLWHLWCSGAKPVYLYSFKAISCSPLPMDKLFDLSGH